MEKVTIEGIVLNVTNYGETSKILNILSREYGYISVISKGSRNIKSRLMGISLKLVYANFTINYKPRGISILIEGSVINSFKYIMTDLKKMNYANFLVELTKSILKDNNNKEIFEDLKNCLLKINESFNPSLLTNIFLIKLLNFLGVKPNFSECIICGNTNVLTYDFKTGGMVCNHCYNDTHIFQSNTLKLLKLFQSVDISKIDKLNISSLEVQREINDFINEYYETYTGIYLFKREKFEV